MIYTRTNFYTLELKVLKDESLLIFLFSYKRTEQSGSGYAGHNLSVQNSTLLYKSHILKRNRKQGNQTDHYYYVTDWIHIECFKHVALYQTKENIKYLGKKRKGEFREGKRRIDMLTSIFHCSFSSRKCFFFYIRGTFN